MAVIRKEFGGGKIKFGVKKMKKIFMDRRARVSR